MIRNCISLFSILFIAASCLVGELIGQCPDVDAGDDEIVCSIPATTSLNGDADGEIIWVEWTPDTYLSDPDVLSPSVFMDEEACVTYTLTAGVVDFSNNLVVNGDFEGGNSDFDTDYTFEANPSLPTNELVEGEYTIGNDPSTMHINWVNCGDHTSGSGEMLIVNGDVTSGQAVWCQDISVDPNTTYIFSAFLASVDPNGPAEIVFLIDGADIGGGAVAISTPCTWEEYFEYWDSGSSSSITICIEDINTATPGNDFVIDDIVFAPICEVRDSVVIKASDVMATLEYDGPVCEDETFILTADGGLTYDWDAPIAINSSDCCVEIDYSEPSMSGYYEVTVTDAIGCTDYMEIEVVVYPTYELDIIEVTCDSSLVGTDDYDLQSVNGCDSIVNLTLVYAPPSYDTIYSFTCDILLAGKDTLTLVNYEGCDSIVINYISFVPADTIYSPRLTCDLTQIGTFSESYFNVSGCDSTVITEITYQDILMTSTIDYTCDNTLAGVFMDTYIGSQGCDSIVTSTIQFIPRDTTTLIEFTCDPLGVGLFYERLVSQYGCDSIIETKIELLQSDFTSISSTSCNPQDEGVYLETLVNAVGCDSIVETTITFQSQDFTSLREVTCDSGGAGVFLEQFINQYGCDSIVETTIDLLPTQEINLELYTCDLDLVGTSTEAYLNQFGCDSIIITSYALQRSDLVQLTEFTCEPNMEGFFRDTLTNIYTCDSIIVTEYILLDSDYLVVNETTCDPSEAGIFSEIFTNVNGCDSLIETEVILLGSDSVMLEQTTCDATLAGVFMDTYTNQVGCDSVVQIIVELLPVDNIEIDDASCDESLSGVFTEILVNQYGCDSTIVTTVTFNPPDTLIQQIETCDSSELGIFYNTLSNQFGCDSVLVLDVNYFSDLGMSLQLSQPDCFGQDQGVINVLATGGTEPLLYSVNGSNFSETSLFDNLPKGNYDITVRDEEGCITSEFVSISGLNPVAVDLGEDLEITYGDSTFLAAQLNVPLDNLVVIDWITLETFDCDTCLIQTILPIASTTYAIEVTDALGCADRDEINVNVVLDKDIYIPNIFTLGENGLNNNFLIFSKEGIVSINSFQGFDRWGNKLWEYFDFPPNDTKYSWDGIYNGYSVNPGVYVWYAEVVFVDGEQKVLSGTISLVK